MKKAIVAVMALGLGSSAAAPLAAQSKPIDPQAAKPIGRFGEELRASSDQASFSEAEKLLWRGDQLSSIDRPLTLTYAFKREGISGDGFTDTVELKILKIKPNGAKSAQLYFLTDERSKYVPPNEETKVNPVIAVYLQGDVLEMNRLTQGNWRYFQRWIKQAIAQDAEVETVRFKFENKMVVGKRVTFFPYLKDPQNARYKKYAGKKYEITISTDLPGVLYQIHTIVPGTTAPLVEETLTLVGAGRVSGVYTSGRQVVTER
ncbi:MAG: hypothetical protein ACREVK_01925 [Gammaproteobacteria bacterium]